MKITRILLAVSISLGFQASVGTAQETVLQSWVTVSRVLAGHVDMGDQAFPAADITVEVRSSDGRKVLASTKTDVNGLFRLGPPKTGGLLYLRLSAPGVKTYALSANQEKG